MITIFDPASVRTTSDVDTLLSDLVQLWNGWDNIEYDGSTVTKLYISANVYLARGTASGTTSQLHIYHTAKGYSETVCNSFNYHIIVTDKGVLCYATSGTDVFCFAVGAMKDADGRTISNGAIVRPKSSSSLMASFWCEDMRSAGTTAVILSTSSSINTQLAKVYPPASAAHFADLMTTIITTNQNAGQSVIGGNYFYIYRGIALPYTP